MTGIMAGELHAAAEQLQKMVNPDENPSLCECLRRGPSRNPRLFSRALSDLETEMYDVVMRMQKVADKGIGEKEEQAEIKKASVVIKSATSLLEETRSRFHIHEYPAGLSFWQKAVINVKKFFGFFTRTRYVEISTTPVDVQKISDDVYVAMTKEFAKTASKNLVYSPYFIEQLLTLSLQRCMQQRGDYKGQVFLRRFLQLFGEDFYRSRSPPFSEGFYGTDVQLRCSGCLLRNGFLFSM